MLNECPGFNLHHMNSYYAGFLCPLYIHSSFGFFGLYSSSLCICGFSIWLNWSFSNENMKSIENCFRNWSWDEDSDEIDKKNSGDGITLIKARNELISIYSYRSQEYTKSEKLEQEKKNKKMWKTGAIHECLPYSQFISNWRHGKFFFAASTAAESNSKEG